MVSPHCASLEPTHRTTHICAHTLVSFHKQESCAVVMETRVPLSPSPHLSYPLLPFMTLSNLLIWNWVLVTQSQGRLLEVEESSRNRRREGGRDEERGSKQVGGDMEVWSWRGREQVCGRPLSPTVSFYVSLPLTGWCRGGHYVPSSQTLICIISACRDCINNALVPIHTHTHNTHREHWVQTRDSEVKSIVYVWVRVHVARLVTLLLYYASCYFRSVHECSLCMPTCANEALQGYALSKEHSLLNSCWKVSSLQYGFWLHYESPFIGRENSKKDCGTRLCVA